MYYPEAARGFTDQRWVEEAGEQINRDIGLGSRERGTENVWKQLGRDSFLNEI